MTAIDALAISMLAVIFLSFGVVGLLFINMSRSASRHDPEIEELMREALVEDEPPPPPGANVPSRKAWEREGDWWQKG